MPEADPVLVFVTRLNQLGARYIVTGSVASIAYGEPRLCSLYAVSAAGAFPSVM
ncbi:MAG: hypothetical protein WCI03_12750 [bacterium]|jgi:hypothetical protein